MTDFVEGMALTVDVTAERYVERMEQVARKRLQPGRDYLPVGGWLPRLERHLHRYPGLMPGTLLTIGGRTGANKTRLATTLAAHAATHGFNVGWLALEIDALEFQSEIRSILTGISLRSDESWTESTAEMGRLRDQGLGKIHVNREATEVSTISDILVWMDHHREQEDVRLFVVDHLQLIQAPEQRHEFAEANHAVRELLKFARDRRCIVVLVSQLNRDHSALKTQPDVGGLWGSRALEQGSQIIILMDHTRSKYDEDTNTTRTWVLLQKNRWGASFKQIPISINYGTHRIREAMDDEVHEWPGATS